MGSPPSADIPTKTDPFSTWLEEMRAFGVDHETRLDGVDGNLLTGGQETIPRLAVTVASTAMTSGTLRLTYFTARRSETIATIFCPNSVAAADVNLIRIGIYTINSGTGAGTLVASCANNTTLWDTLNGQKSATLSSPYALVAGTRYAVGSLYVANTPPGTPAQVPAAAGGGTSFTGAFSNAPRLAANFTGRADLPSSFATSDLTNSSAAVYMELRP